MHTNRISKKKCSHLWKAVALLTLQYYIVECLKCKMWAIKNKKNLAEQ